MRHHMGRGCTCQGNATPRLLCRASRTHLLAQLISSLFGILTECAKSGSESLSRRIKVAVALSAWLHATDIVKVFLDIPVEAVWRVCVQNRCGVVPRPPI